MEVARPHAKALIWGIVRLLDAANKILDYPNAWCFFGLLLNDMGFMKIVLLNILISFSKFQCLLRFGLCSLLYLFQWQWFPDRVITLSLLVHVVSLLKKHTDCMLIICFFEQFVDWVMLVFRSLTGKECIISNLLPHNKHAVTILEQF